MRTETFLAGLPTDAALDASNARAFAVPFVLEEPWRGAGARTQLHAAYFRDTSNGTLRAFVTDAPLERDLPTSAESFAALAARHRAALLDFGRPFRLETVDVPKPWGIEVWYTGYERRGVSRVTDQHGSTPLPWALACAPRRLCNERAILLLKILSSSPQPVRGALYLELHREKREVYVVTGIDRGAWPDGVAAVRYGVNQESRRAHASDAAFRAAFAAAVKRYEAVRRDIDDTVDAGKQPAAQMLRDEAEARAAMDAFTMLHPLAIGDGVCVPTLVPHSLQHGIRAIEVQTPTYERLVIAAGYKVLTQSHWDTDEAALTMRLDLPPRASIPAESPADGVVLERLVAPGDFTVTRYRLAPGASHRLRIGGVYALAIVASGEVSVDTTVLGTENACMLPGTMHETTLSNRSNMDAALLVAMPE